MLNIETIEVNFTEDNIDSNVVIFQDGSVVIQQRTGDTAQSLSLEAIELIQHLSSEMVDFTIDSGLTDDSGNYETGDIEDLNEDAYDGIDSEINGNEYPADGGDNKAYPW